MIVDIAYDLKYNEDSKLMEEVNETHEFKTSYKKITNETVDKYIKEAGLEEFK